MPCRWTSAAWACKTPNWTTAAPRSAETRPAGSCCSSKVLGGTNYAWQWLRRWRRRRLGRCFASACRVVAATQLRLTAPGDVEIKEGADVVSRTVDDAAKVTRFELLPREGDTSLVMTLNSHLQRQQRAVVARSVLIDEVTQAYEKLHATVSLGILYRAVDRFSFAVPEGFEITEVGSPLLARWDVRQEGGRKLLNVRLREQTTETVVLKIAAIRTPGQLDAWHAPRLEPLDVVGSVTVLGLLVEDRLKAQSLAPGA